MTDKIKITQKEIDDVYQVDAGTDTSTEGSAAATPPKPELKEPEPEFLTEEETEIEDKFSDDIKWNEEKEVESY